MKKTQTLRGLLGVSQDDLALLLKVSRTTFSMYEIGSRALPTESTVLLADMIQYMCGTSLKSAGVAAQYAQRRHLVARLQKENDYQQQATTRKMAYVTAKCEDYLKALQLVEFLSTRAEYQQSDAAALLRSIAHKANQGLKTQGLAKLFSLELKLELLQCEKLLLDYEEIKIARALENSGGKYGF